MHQLQPRDQTRESIEIYSKRKKRFHSTATKNETKVNWESHECSIAVPEIFLDQFRLWPKEMDTNGIFNDIIFKMRTSRVWNRLKSNKRASPHSETWQDQNQFHLDSCNRVTKDRKQKVKMFSFCKATASRENEHFACFSFGRERK